MTDQVPSVRVTSASARKALLSFLGALPATVPENSKPGNGVSTQTASTPDPRREARQETTNIWKEATEDSTSLEHLVTPPVKAQESGLAKILNSGQRNSIDDELLRRRVLGSRNQPKPGGRRVESRAGPAKRGHVALESHGSGVIEGDSSEEEGRSALGKSRLAKESQGRRKVKRGMEVETYAIVEQADEDVLEDDGEDVAAVSAISTQSGTRRESRKPQSYLDELLEGKRNRQSKKKRRKKEVVKQEVMPVKEDEV